MINFHSQSEFTLKDELSYRLWLDKIVSSEKAIVRSLDFIFCTDEYLLGINQQFLDHDTYTDIITFDYSANDLLEGEIYISTDRVAENAVTFNVSFHNELLRVLAHGVLHLLGYGDKLDSEIRLMRSKEQEKIMMFHVKQ